MTPLGGVTAAQEAYSARNGRSCSACLPAHASRTRQARARRRHHRRRWVLSSIAVERARQRYARSGELHCMWWEIR